MDRAWINLNEGGAIGQVGIEHDLLTTNEKDPGDDGFDGNGRTIFEAAFRWVLEKKCYVETSRRKK